MPDPLYRSVDAIRKDGGITEAEANAVELEAAIRTWQKAIDRVCRQWFFSKALEMFVDGSGSGTLFFGVPIIDVSELRINGSSTPLEANKYHVYTELDNPRISLVGRTSDPNDIYRFPFDSNGTIFQHGPKNTFVKGNFGYLEDGAAPLLIQRALTLLVLEKIRNPINPEQAAVAYAPPNVPGILRDEWVDGHRRRYDVAGGRIAETQPWISGLTNNPEVKQILRMYRAPIGLATPYNTNL